MDEKTFVQAMYFVSKKVDDDWDVVKIMVTHVDDLAWSDTPESYSIITYTKGKFPIDKEATGDSKFTDHEITQGSDFTVRLKCRDTTMKMGKVGFAADRGGVQPAPRHAHH